MNGGAAAVTIPTPIIAYVKIAWGQDSFNAQQAIGSAKDGAKRSKSQMNMGCFCTAQRRIQFQINDHAGCGGIMTQSPFSRK
jgi:hypothetical protein